jgi:hypothetical protein
VSFGAGAAGRSLGGAAIGWFVTGQTAVPSSCGKPQSLQRMKRSRLLTGGKVAAAGTARQARA